MARLFPRAVRRPGSGEPDANPVPFPGNLIEMPPPPPPPIKTPAGRGPEMTKVGSSETQAMDLQPGDPVLRSSAVSAGTDMESP